MKLFLTFVLGLLIAIPHLMQGQVVGEPMFSQEKNARKSPLAQASKTIDEGLTINIEYGSPAVKGRKIWGGLVPFDTVWRTGANEATTFETTQDVMVEGQLLKAGRYALFTIPSEGEWTVIFNKVADQWGAYNYNASEDELRIKVAADAREEVAEHLFIAIDDHGMVSIVWELLEVTFSVQKPS